MYEKQKGSWDQEKERGISRNAKDVKKNVESNKKLDAMKKEINENKKKNEMKGKSVDRKME